MSMSLALALDVLADPPPGSARRSQAITRLYEELRRLAGGDPGRQDAIQAIGLRLCGAPLPAHPGRTDDEARAYLLRALAHATTSQHRRHRRELPLEEAETPVVPAAEAAHAATTHFVHALEHMRRADLPRALAHRRRPDHRRHLVRGIKLRARQLTAALVGGPCPRLNDADERASRRAAQLLRRLYPIDDPDPIAACIGHLASLDLRATPA